MGLSCFSACFGAQQPGQIGGPSLTPLTTISQPPKQQLQQGATKAQSSDQPLHPKLLAYSPVQQDVGKTLQGAETGRVLAGPLQPVVLMLQRELVTLKGTWVSRLEAALQLVKEHTGAVAVSLAMLSELQDSFVVLARCGPDDLLLHPGTCISVSEAGGNVQFLDGEQHSLQFLYTDKVAVVRRLPVGGNLVGMARTMPMDWAHLHVSAGVTHFAALPLFHGPSLAGALTILGGCSTDLQPAAAPSAPAAPGAASAAGSARAQTPPLTPFAQLIEQPMSLEVVAAAVTQCCLGPDAPLAQHVCSSLQAMSSCASIQQLVGAITLGVQAVLTARLCLALRCNVALAVEHQPNALMFEDVTVPGAEGRGACSTSMTGAHSLAPSEVSKCTPNRQSFGVGGPAGAADAPAKAHTFGAHDLHSGAPSRSPSQGFGALAHASAHAVIGHGASSHLRSGPIAGAGNTDANDLLSGSAALHGPNHKTSTASTLLHRLMTCRFKARPFSVYHTLLIQTIHGLGSSNHNGIVVLQCHDHMQDAKTPSRDMYALGQGAGLPPASLVLAVVPLRPYGMGGAGGGSAGFGGGGGGSAGGGIPAGTGGAAPDGSASGPSPPLSFTYASTASPLPPARHESSGMRTEPRTYLALYVTSTDPLPSPLLESVLIELDSLARHLLSPLVHLKLMAGGELGVEWQLLQAVACNHQNGNVPSHNGGAVNSGSGGATSSAPKRQPTGESSSLQAQAAAGAAAAAAAAGGTAAFGGKAPPAAVGRAGSMARMTSSVSSVSALAGHSANTVQQGVARRLSSLQRIMMPFLTNEGLHDANTAGGNTTASGAPDGSVPPIGRGRAASSECTAAAANAANSNIKRVLAFDATSRVTGGHSIRTASEGVARELLLAAAGLSQQNGTGDGSTRALLSTEVATAAGHDTRSQMSLLLTSYKETLHNMQMELVSTNQANRSATEMASDDPGRLVLREVLGKGGHGVVFRGSMHTLEVAIKVFQTPGEDEPLAGSSTQRPEALAEALLQRRRVLSRAALELAIMGCTSHPNIVQVYAQWPSAILERDETQPCRRRLRRMLPETPLPLTNGLLCAVMVMEYCDKGTLVDAINRGDFLSATRDGQGFKPNYRAIYTTLLEVALSLRHIHAMGITHCDLKPANVLLRSSPRDPRGFTAKLADFGYAALLKDSAPDGHRSVVTDEACGTVTHMAPEMFVEGEPVDSSSDVYALGILMWELVSGKQPYHDRNLKALPHEVVNKGLRPAFATNIPDVYKAMAKACWSPLPRQRPTAASLVSSIQAQLDKIEAVAKLLGKA